MPRTVFFRAITAVNRRNRLSCVWVSTGNARSPLAQVWISAEESYSCDSAEAHGLNCTLCA